MAALAGNREILEMFGASRRQHPSAVYFLLNEAAYSGGAASNCAGRRCFNRNILLFCSVLLIHLQTSVPKVSFHLIRRETQRQRDSLETPQQANLKREKEGKLRERKKEKDEGRGMKRRNNSSARAGVQLQTVHRLVRLVLDSQPTQGLRTEETSIAQVQNTGGLGLASINHLSWPPPDLGAITHFALSGLACVLNIHNIPMSTSPHAERLVATHNRQVEA